MIEEGHVQASREPSGLGGWLILVAIGLVLNPLKIGALVVATFLPIFQNGTWALLTTPGEEAYHVLWGPVILFELVGNLVMIAIAVALLVLFFRRSRHFPKTYIFFMLGSLLFILVDAWAVSLVLPEEPILDPETLKEVMRWALACVIWVPYMLSSKRVANTFVE